MKKPYCTSLKKKQQKAVFNLLKVEQAAVQVSTGHSRLTVVTQGGITQEEVCQKSHSDHVHSAI